LQDKKLNKEVILQIAIKAINDIIRPDKLVLTVGGRTLARRRPYKNDTRKPSNRTRRRTHM